MYLSSQLQYQGDWFTQYTTPTSDQSPASSCQRARYTPNQDGTFGVWNTGQDFRERQVVW